MSCVGKVCKVDNKEVVAASVLERHPWSCVL